MQFKNFDVLKIGNELEITGVIYGNANEDIIIMLPGNEVKHISELLQPTLDEWNQIIRQSDLLEIELVNGDPNKKVVLRKSTRQIDQQVSWEVFRRDNYKCRYCGANKVPLTVDHMVLWEEGGPTIDINLITSCKKCNHTRGSMKYEDWLQSALYLKVSLNIDEFAHLLNKTQGNRIPEIISKHLRINQRSR